MDNTVQTAFVNLFKVWTIVLTEGTIAPSLSTVKLLYNGTPRFPGKVPYNWGVLIKKLIK